MGKLFGKVCRAKPPAKIADLNNVERAFLREWDREAGLAWLEGKRPMTISYEDHAVLKKILERMGYTGENIVSRWAGVPAQVEFSVVNDSVKSQHQKHWGQTDICKGPAPEGVESGLGQSIFRGDETMEEVAKMADKEVEEKSNPEKPIHVLIRVSRTDPAFCNRLQIETPPGGKFIPNVWVCDRRKDHLGDCTTVRVESSVQYVHKVEE